MRQIRPGGFILALCLLLSLAHGYSSAQQFEGRVFAGDVGDESTPLSGVTITLYHSSIPNDVSPAAKGSSTTTDGNGWYKLDIPGPSDYWEIVETDPSGYNSTGARSVDGTVINSNQIEYSGDVLTKTLSGNKFYDKVNNPPIAKIKIPTITYPGCPTHLDGTGSYDPDAGDSIATYLWTHRYAGSGYSSPFSDHKEITWVPAATGEVTIALYATDTHGATAGDSSILMINPNMVFSGHVFEGDVGVETTPINGVSLKLYGSNDPAILGSEIGSATTDVSGSFDLATAPVGYVHFTIIETDPGGYISTGALSLDGIIIDLNTILYEFFDAHNPSEKNLTNNRFFDRLSSTSVGNQNNSTSLPDQFKLYSNYPNPFNPSTTIGYDLPSTAHVHLVVTDILGREVATLINGVIPAGHHEAEFSAGNLASGVYFYRLEAGPFVQMSKMLLVR